MSNESDDKGNKQEDKKQEKTDLKLVAFKPNEGQTKKVEFPPIEYDFKILQNFFDLVFGDSEDPEENVLAWGVKAGGFPSFPITEPKLMALLKNSNKARCLYFGTSTAANCPVDKRPYNRKNLFKRFYVLVLDDVGTKIPFDKIPKELEPTYIIESSEGNFQYGYVLDTPLDNIEHAEALVHLAYTAGYSDEGGKMATKLVRLPEGVNGKQGERGQFRVQLTKTDGPKWTPEKLLKAMAIPYTWADIQTDPSIVIKRNTYKRVDSSVWAGTKAAYASETGAVDPVLEWLHDNDLIVSDNGEWLTIKCPWKAHHTSGSDTAGYKPIGRGDDPDSRGYHCFHGHCESQKTTDFLEWVGANSGIEVGVTDFAAGLLTRFIFDDVNDGSWEMFPSGASLFRKMTPFKNKFIRFQHQLGGFKKDGSIKKTPATSLWLGSPMLVKVSGAAFDASENARLIKHGDQQFINTFVPPRHDPAPIDMEQVDRFLDYLEYLIPDDEQLDYFTQWLCAKVKDLSFRGAAIVMFTHGTQGIGRSTLMHMITQLINRENSRTVPFVKLVKDESFNEWMASPFIMVEEALSLGDSSFYKNYERLKELVDPRENWVEINQKYGNKVTAKCHTSFLFLSNHPDGVKLPNEDRRFYPIANPDIPETPEFFVALNDWIENSDWAQHVYNWILTQEPDLPMLLRPPPQTAAKIEMLAAGKTETDIIFDVLASEITGFFAPFDIKEIVEELSSQHPLPEGTAQIIQRHRVNSTSISIKEAIKVRGKATRGRIFVKNLDTAVVDPRKPLTKEGRGMVRIDMEEINVSAIVAKIKDKLDSLGM